MVRGTYAKEMLLSTTLAMNTTANGRTCFATGHSNSNMPPPAIPPLPPATRRSNPGSSPCAFAGPLNPCPVDSGVAGATTAPKPSLWSGLDRSRVKPANPINKICASTNCIHVAVNGYGNLYTPATPHVSKPIPLHQQGENTHSRE